MAIIGSAGALKKSGNFPEYMGEKPLDSVGKAFERAEEFLANKTVERVEKLAQVSAVVEEVTLEIPHLTGAFQNALFENSVVFDRHNGITETIPFDMSIVHDYLLSIGEKSDNHEVIQAISNGDIQYFEKSLKGNGFRPELLLAMVAITHEDPDIRENALGLIPKLLKQTSVYDGKRWDPNTGETNGFTKRFNGETILMQMFGNIEGMLLADAMNRGVISTNGLMEEFADLSNSIGELLFAGGIGFSLISDERIQKIKGFIDGFRNEGEPKWKFSGSSLKRKKRRAIKTITVMCLLLVGCAAVPVNAAQAPGLTPPRGGEVTEVPTEAPRNFNRPTGEPFEIPVPVDTATPIPSPEAVVEEATCAVTDVQYEPDEITYNTIDHLGVEYGVITSPVYKVEEEEIAVDIMSKTLKEQKLSSTEGVTIEIDGGNAIEAVDSFRKSMEACSEQFPHDDKVYVVRVPMFGTQPPKVANDESYNIGLAGDISVSNFILFVKNGRFIRLDEIDGRLKDLYSLPDSGAYTMDYGEFLGYSEYIQGMFAKIRMMELPFDIDATMTADESIAIKQALGIDSPYPGRVSLLVAVP